MMIILMVFVMTKLMEIELVMTYIVNDIVSDIGHGDLLSQQKVIEVKLEVTRGIECGERGYGDESGECGFRGE